MPEPRRRTPGTRSRRAPSAPASAPSTDGEAPPENEQDNSQESQPEQTVPTAQDEAPVQPETSPEDANASAAAAPQATENPGEPNKGGRPQGSRNTAVVLDDPQFEEPPESATARQGVATVWTKVAEALRSNPGKYARVSTHVNSESAKQAASGLRNGTRKGFEPKGAFEAKFGQIGDTNQYGVWARFIGENEATQS